MAAVRDVSGIGITTSMSWSGRTRRIFVGELLAHAHARLVDRQVVDDRVRAREVHELEDARRVADARRRLAAVQVAALVDEHGLARQDVALELEADGVERHALGSDHVLDAVRRLANAEHERPDAVRVAERDDAVADDHRDDRVAAGATFVQRLDGVEDLLRLHAVRRRACRARVRTRSAATSESEFVFRWR